MVRVIFGMNLTARKFRHAVCDLKADRHGEVYADCGYRSHDYNAATDVPEGAWEDSSMDARLPEDGRLRIPEALRLGHEEMRAHLARSAMEPGRIGRVATRVARLCLPHFEQEEKAVFPIFGLLNDVALGEVRTEMAAFLPLISRFTTWHGTLGNHHQNIFSAAGELLEAALREGNREIADFAHKLQLHEELEEEVIYPTAILIGKYVREKLAV